jgi:hypothetical protein
MVYVFHELIRNEYIGTDRICTHYLQWHGSTFDDIMEMCCITL